MLWAKLEADRYLRDRAKEEHEELEKKALNAIEVKQANLATLRERRRLEENQIKDRITKQEPYPRNRSISRQTYARKLKS